MPDDPWEQLLGAVAAVFGSWQSARARAYRRHYGISDDLGTAVVVQVMVFGNLDDASGTGVYFTRDPLTGAPEPYGEYLPGGQGEDVVSGTATPLPVSIALAGQRITRRARKAIAISSTAQVPTESRICAIESSKWKPT